MSALHPSVTCQMDKWMEKNFFCPVHLAVVVQLTLLNVIFYR